MRIVAVAVTVIILGIALVLFGRYDYVQRGGEAVRVDRITGRTAVLRPVQGGGATWASLKTPEDIEAERERCTKRALPSSQREKVSTTKNGRFVHVRNASAWNVQEIEATMGAAQVLLRRVDDSTKLDRNDPLNEYAIRIADSYPAASQVVPGFEADFEPTAGVPDGPVAVLRVSGVPSDCH